MKSVLLIIVYFGKFKPYFPLFLKSCKKNQNINWLIVTDNEINNPPSNVQVKKMSFELFKKLAAKKLPFDFVLNEPYKICDFKPTYGLIFQDYLKNYDFWGHCDCDLIFGNISSFLEDILEKKYDKIFAAGHLTIYRNEYENNCRFMKNYWGANQIERVFQSEKTMGFDEAFYPNGNVHQIFLENSAHVFETDFCANPMVSHAQFVLTKYDPQIGGFKEQPYRKTMYIWDYGELYGLNIVEGELCKTPYIYMHFQNRNMKIDDKFDIERCNRFYIVPNKFMELDRVPVSIEEWSSFNLEPNNSHKRDLFKQKIKYKVKRVIQLIKF